MPEQKSRGRPLWLGEYPLARKTVLLHAEQGFGDTIQFARYVPLLAATGAKVVLEVQPELTALMARLDGAATIIARGAAPPRIRRALSAGQPAARVARPSPATVPADIPYLSADDAHLANGRRGSARWNGRASPSPGRAMPAISTTATARSPSRGLRRLLSMPARFVSIQRDVRSEDAD